jgi:hypothetical protein
MENILHWRMAREQYHQTIDAEETVWTSYMLEH